MTSFIMNHDYLLVTVCFGKWTIEIVDLPIKDGDFPVRNLLAHDPQLAGACGLPRLPNSHACVKLSISLLAPDPGPQKYRDFTKTRELDGSIDGFGL
jgi:hypothetical protein